MTKKIEIKELNLLTLKDKRRWNTLKRMTVPGWCAQDTFKTIQRSVEKNLDKAYDVAKILLLYLNGRPVSWNLHISGGDRSNEIWAYTKPKFRQKGLQKILLPKSRKIFGKGLDFQDWDDCQAKTFKYYEKS
jgi:hypothetical protein